MPEIPQRLDEKLHIVTVDGTEVSESQFLEKRPRHDQGLDTLLDSARELL